VQNLLPCSGLTNSPMPPVMKFGRFIAGAPSVSVIFQALVEKRKLAQTLRQMS